VKYLELNQQRPEIFAHAQQRPKIFAHEKHTFKLSALSKLEPVNEDWTNHILRQVKSI